mmetsp:Transcript_47552/g.123139  ORF Transcript_47552/g.123139 Transcript_47552/m.123139 type:complete len:95 (+) Transcript_47552:2210-2494(+)
MKHTFVPFIRDLRKDLEVSPKQEVVLFLDSHHSHVTSEISRYAQANHITLITLLSNCTHVLQPLDVYFFGIMKNVLKKIEDEICEAKNIENARQ